MYASEAADMPSHDRHHCRLRRRTFVVDVYAVHSGRHSQHRCCAARHTWSLLHLATPTSTVPVSAMAMNGEAGRDTLSKVEEDGGGSSRERHPLLVSIAEERGEDESDHSRTAEEDAAVHECGGRGQWCHLRRRAAGVLCHGVWSISQIDAQVVDEATDTWDVGGSAAMRRRVRELLQGQAAHVATCVPRATEALSPFLEWRVTFYREPLQPDHIVVYALYRWASADTYESGTCSFGIGRSSGLVVVRDVTEALLSVYADKISWPTGLQKAVVLRAFAYKGFPNCHGCIDCTHIFINKPANCPREDYYDRKRRFSVQAQVVVDLNEVLRVLDVFVGYSGSCHDVRIVHLLSLWARAEAG
ncbi:hypothetical protein CBR_g29523 [Chara braunii]|uniref:DDE Tnp4 domain-containing protein n=1 Tax=Chara braunii TaxID=69332 RepID=A0A388LAR9_CHABU|nr:hypothetical protein CBR_g29523 [Chara braunii]|eukprot:GBG79374.1 hypothetical protein CBR_g29523 [Chara braunii]